MGQESQFPQLKLRRLARVTSTQDVALRAARSGAAEGFCCLAADQTAGRGRQGRRWLAGPNTALLASVLLRRRPDVAQGVPLAAGLAVVDALGATCAVEAHVKWPNDVLVGGRKLAGILTEVEPVSSTPERLAVALGLGLNLRSGGIPATLAAVAIDDLTAEPPDAEVLLHAWLGALAAHLDTLEASGIGGIAGDWRRNAAGLGEMVTVHGPAGVLTGIALDIDEEGALLVGSAGTTVRVLAGDVHLTGPGYGTDADSPDPVT